MTTFLQKFSTRKDAIAALDFIIEELNLITLTEPIDITGYKQLREQIAKMDGGDLAKQVLDRFNEVNDTRYANLSHIQAIIKQIPRVTFEQFESVIMHKAETWGRDAKMRPYVRPATLFGSKNKFITYLDDAMQHWIDQTKTNKYEQTGS
jgi:uncharacterized phage protein (TIGR02220 family)